MTMRYTKRPKAFTIGGLIKISSKKGKNGYFVPRVMRQWRNAGERMTSRGWRGERGRHALASRGIKTTSKYIDIEKYNNVEERDR